MSACVVLLTPIISCDSSLLLKQDQILKKFRRIFRPFEALSCIYQFYHVCPRSTNLCARESGSIRTKQSRGLPRPHKSGFAMTPHFVIARHDSAEAIPVGATRLPHSSLPSLGGQVARNDTFRLSLPGRRSRPKQSQQGKVKTVVRGFSLVQGKDGTALKGRTTCVFSIGLPRFARNGHICNLCCFLASI